MHATTLDHEHAKLAHDDVHAYANRAGQLVVTLPDAIADRLFAEIDAGPGVFPADTWGYCASTLLIAHYAATPIPEGLAPHWHMLAELDRAAVVGARSVQAFVCAASAYDPDAADWAGPHAAVAHLRTWAYPERSYGQDAVVWREWNA